MKLALASSLLALPAGSSSVSSVTRKLQDNDVTITNDYTNQDSVSEIQWNPTCDCQPMPPQKSSYQVVRLWNIVDTSMTDQDVIKEFNTGFAPVVTNMPGFQRYMASSTGNSTTVFFLNQFDTQEEARAAQEAAKEFVAKGTLNGKITPNLFTQGKGYFAAPLDTCIKYPTQDDYLARRQDYLSVRFHKFVDPASVNTTALFSGTQSFYEEFIKGDEGLVTYYNAEGGDYDVAWNMYKTEEQAIQSNQQSVNWTMPDDYPATDRVGSAAGIIAFDYTCSAGNRPAAPTPTPAPHGPDWVSAEVTPVPDDESTTTGPPSAAFSTSFSVASAVSAAVFIMFWQTL